MHPRALDETMNPYRILCVDDDPDVLINLEAILKKSGYEVVTAGSAEEGLRKCERSMPDFVLVDMMMEQIDSGASLVTKMKAMGCKAPMYMLSAIGDQITETTNPKALGLDGVFQKPIDPKALLATLRSRLP